MGSWINRRVFFSFYIFVDASIEHTCSVQSYEAAFAHLPTAGTLTEFLVLCDSGYLRLESGEPCWQLSHTCDLTTALNNLEMGFAFGKIMQVFPAWRPEFLHAEIALLTAPGGTAWMCLCAEGDDGSSIPRFCSSLRFNLCYSSPVPCLDGYLKLSLWPGCKTEFWLFVCIQNVVCLYEQVCLTPGVLANFQLG